MITIPTAASLQTNILSYFSAAFPGRDIGTASYLGQWARVLTEALLGVYQSIRDAETGAIPSSATASARLDEFAVLFGLPDGSGTAGKYGRKVATIATGGGATWTYSGAGPFVYTLTAGQLLYAPDGVTQLQTTANVTWAAAGSGTGSGSISAITKGTVGNLAIGAVLSLVSPPAGINNSVTLTTATSGAIDVETDAALLARLLDRLQNPPKGGAAADWRGWATAVSGVSAAYVYPRRNGTGTVDLVYTQAGSGQSRRITDSTVLANIATAVDLARSVTTEGRRLLTAYMPNGVGMALIARVTPTSGNAFDWDSSGVARTVSAYSAGTPSVTFDVAPTADFISAVNGGSPRRIQVVSVAGTSVLPQIAYVTAYNAGTKVATLAAPFATAVAATDIIHAGGSVVAPVAKAILDLVDSLGPSKASGYASSGATWDDTLRVDAIIAAAIAAVDAAGARLVLDFVTDPTINGAASNLQAGDDGTNAPAMLYTKSIAVTP